jgi:uncharacterized membrane protein
VSRVRDTNASQRLVVVVVLGVLTSVMCAFLAPWQFAVLAGWIIAGTVTVVWVWSVVLRCDAAETQRVATREDNSRVATHLMLLGAAVVSLVGTVFDLVKAEQVLGQEGVVLSVAGVLAVVVSWGVVHTMFLLRYAHLYYIAPVGGIDFKTDERPDYHDFAYVAFTIGMTFQVSDTDIESRAIRRTVLRHSLIAFLFGAVILGLTVNIVASVLQ